MEKKVEKKEVRAQNQSEVLKKLVVKNFLPEGSTGGTIIVRGDAARGWIRGTGQTKIKVADFAKMPGYYIKLYPNLLKSHATGTKEALEFINSKTSNELKEIYNGKL